MRKDWETKTSFLSDPKIKQIEEKIFIYKNFIPKEEVQALNQLLLNRYNNIREKDTETLIPWYEEKVLTNIPELYPVWEKMSEFLYPTHIIHPRLDVLVIQPGDGGMPPHSDSPGEGHEHELTNYDVWNVCARLDYGIIIYFGEYTGGAVYYPYLDIEIQPEPGDMIIHGAHQKHFHGVKEVESGVRFAFNNFALPYDRNPGSFYSFNSAEFNHLKEQDDFLAEFRKPLLTNQREYKKLEKDEWENTKKHFLK